jgi:flagellar M-ring protein FliF
LGALILVLIGGIGFLVFRKKKQQQEVVEELDAVNAKPVLPTIDYENVNDNQVRKQLETLAKRKPEDFVNLLRTWLVDE